MPAPVAQPASIPEHQQDPNAHPKVLKVVATSGAAQTLDFSAFDVFDLTLTASCTFTFSNLPPMGDSSEKILVLRQDGTGSRTGTFPATVLFSGGSKTLTTTASAIDKVTLRRDPSVAGSAPGQCLAELTKAYA